MSYTKLQNIRELGGFQFKEEGVSLTGTCNGVNKDFYVPISSKPIIDTDYSDTVTAADLTVYDDGVAVIVSSIDAPTGKITLTAAPASQSVMTCDYSWSNLSDTYIDSFRDKAENEINGFLGSRYSLPLSETPELISSLASELAAALIIMSNYSLMGGRGDEGLKRAREVRAMLLQISKGTVQLIKSDGSVLTNNDVSSPDSSVSSSDENTELFTLNDENFRLGQTTNDVGDDWP